jgi:hypothetical protein
MSEKSPKKVTFSAEPDVSPDDGPLPAPAPLVSAVGIGAPLPPPEHDSLAEADALIADIAKAQNPRNLAEVQWVQFVVPARLSGKSGAVGAISATKTSRLLFDPERGCVEVCSHGTLVPLSNVAAFGLVVAPSTP